MEMKSNLGRCAEHLLKAVKHLAISSERPQEKLKSMSRGAPGFLSISADQFPKGELRDDFQVIDVKMKNVTGISDEEASGVIERICELSDDVARSIGKAM